MIGILINHSIPFQIRSGNGPRTLILMLYVPPYMTLSACMEKRAALAMLFILKYPFENGSLIFEIIYSPGGILKIYP